MQPFWRSYLYGSFGSHFVFPSLAVRGAPQSGASQSKWKTVRGGFGSGSSGAHVLAPIERFSLAGALGASSRRHCRR